MRMISQQVLLNSVEVPPVPDRVPDPNDFPLEVAEISLELHTVEHGHLTDGTETKAGKSEVR
jgi:hypothetical protein